MKVLSEKALSFIKSGLFDVTERIYLLKNFIKGLSIDQIKDLSTSGLL